MKKGLLVGFASAATMALVVSPALALETGLEYGTLIGLGTRDLREGVMGIIQLLFGFLGIIALVLILYAGFLWMTAGGNEEKVGQAKQIISAAIVGLVIIFCSYMIASFVISQLVIATGAQ